MSIVVIGATGNIGKPLVQELLSKGQTVVAVTRDTKKSSNLFGNNVNVKFAEVTDTKNAGQLEAALKGATKVAIIKPFAEYAVEFTQLYVNAAKKVGTVKHIVLLSGAGSSDATDANGMQKFLRAAEKVVESSGLTYTLIRPTFFHSNMLTSAAQIKRGEFSINSSLLKPQTTIDVRDIASAFAAVLTSDVASHAGKIYDLAAEESPLGYTDKIKIIQKFVPQTIHVTDITAEALASQLLSYGVPKWTVERLDDLSNIMKNGAPPNTHHLKQLTGKDGITFEQYIKENAEAFGNVTVVVGATGNIGVPLVNELADKHFVRAVTRNTKKNPFESKRFVKLIELKDTKDPAIVEHLLRGADNLVLIKPFDKEAISITEAYIAAAKKVGIKHIVLLSAFGANANTPFGMAKFQAKIEEIVEKSGISFTHVRPTFFHTNIFLSAPEMQHFGSFTDASNNGKQSLIDCRDIGSAIAAIVTTPGHAGKVYELSNEETPLTSPEKIEIINKYLKDHNKHIKYNLTSREQYIANLTSAGLDEFTKSNLVDLQDIITNGWGVNKNNTELRKLIGRPGITFEQWAKENIQEISQLVK
jgi:uncharacterized protein YbjT (DUF2867 family)